MNLILWQECLDYLQKTISGEQFTKYISPIQIDIKKNNYILFVPNIYIKEKIKSNYLSIIKNKIDDIYKKKYNITLEIGPTMNEKNIPKNKIHYKHDIYASYNINEHKTLNNFFDNDSNEMIFNKISNKKYLGKIYNPLFIYGNTNSGKTHLIHALGNEIIKKNPNLLVITIKSEKFIQDVIYSIKQQQIHEFRKTYISCDILIIDDIHNIYGKKRTQEEFIYIFNILTEKQKQIIIASDYIPLNNHNINKKLESKLLSGLIIHVTKPQFKNYVNIFNNNKKNDSNLDIINNSKNIKFKNINNPKIIKKQIYINDIINIIIKYYNIEKTLLNSKNRCKTIVKIRQIAFYLCKKLTKNSLSEIGEFIGKYKHTTVLYSYNKIKTFKKKNKTINDDIKNIIKIIMK